MSSSSDFIYIAFEGYFVIIVESTGNGSKASLPRCLPLTKDLFFGMLDMVYDFLVENPSINYKAFGDFHVDDQFFAGITGKGMEDIERKRE